MCCVALRKARSLYWSPDECWECPKIRAGGDSIAVLCCRCSMSMDMWSVSLIQSPLIGSEKIYPHTAFGHDLSMRRFEKSSLTAAYRHANTVCLWQPKWEAACISCPLSPASVTCTSSRKGNKAEAICLCLLGQQSQEREIQESEIGEMLFAYASLGNSLFFICKRHKTKKKTRKSIRTNVSGVAE